jgi:hypothetical protein
LLPAFTYYGKGEIGDLFPQDFRGIINSPYKSKERNALFKALNSFVSRRRMFHLHLTKEIKGLPRTHNCVGNSRSEYQSKVVRSKRALEGSREIP